MKRLFSDGGTAVRAFVRAVTVCATAFGLKLTADQVAAVQIVVEAALQLGVQVAKGKEG